MVISLCKFDMTVCTNYEGRTSLLSTKSASLTHGLGSKCTTLRSEPLILWSAQVSLLFVSLCFNILWILFQQQSLCMYIQLDILTYCLALRITIHGRDTGIMQKVLVAVILGATSSVWEQVLYSRVMIAVAVFLWSVMSITTPPPGGLLQHTALY